MTAFQFPHQQSSHVHDAVYQLLWSAIQPMYQINYSLRPFFSSTSGPLITPRLACTPCHMTEPLSLTLSNPRVNPKSYCALELDMLSSESSPIYLWSAITCIQTSFLLLGILCRFAALFGRILSEMAIDGETSFPVEPFTIDRPAITDPNFEMMFQHKLSTPPGAKAKLWSDSYHTFVSYSSRKHTATM